MAFSEVRKPICPLERKTQAATLPIYLVGAVQPHPDCHWPDMLRDGICYRAARRLPNVTLRGFWDRLSTFLESYIMPEFGLDHLDFDELLDFEGWLALTNYPEWRKVELREAFNDIKDPTDKLNFVVKLFMKDEHYNGFKQGRGIYARVDAAKVLFGPLVKKLEEVVYKHPAFIKHVPVDQRAQYIHDRLYTPDSKYLATDWTSFEGHMSPEMFGHVEFLVYRLLMGKFCGYQQWLLNLMQAVVSGRNILEHKDFHGYIFARRMSGEMNTSLGNGLVNYILMRFWCHVSGIETVGVVEGDDGLFRVPIKAELDQTLFTQMGCLVKMEEHYSVETAGFCQNVFDAIDLRNIVDPRKILCNFGWVKRKYLKASKKTKMQLLRIKALSMIYQNAGCPIVHTLASRILALTSGHNIGNVGRKYLSGWWQHQMYENILDMNLKEKLETPISPNSRALMAERFNISIPEQIMIENEISNWDLAPHCSPLILSIMTDHDVDNYNQYVKDGDDFTHYEPFM